MGRLIIDFSGHLKDFLRTDSRSKTIARAHYLDSLLSKGEGSVAASGGAVPVLAWGPVQPNPRSSFPRVASPGRSVPLVRILQPVFSEYHVSKPHLFFSFARAHMAVVFHHLLGWHLAASQTSRGMFPRQNVRGRLCVL